MEKKLISKKIISKTLLFIGMLLFISLFKSIFGSKNSTVGITTVMLVLILMSQNLSVNPIKNIIKLILINLITGVATYISSQNIYWGIIIDFSTMWFIGYFFSVTLSKSVILPFGLQYLFLLYAPVTGNDLVKRFIGLALAPFLIMLAQYFIYGRNKKVKVKKSDLLEFGKVDDTYETVEFLGKEFKINKMRANYALRLSVLITIVVFINGLILLPRGISEGRWMAYTVFSVTELFGERCRVKSKKRMQATIIGGLIVLVLFILIKSPVHRGIIIIVAGYLNSFFDDYRDLMICVTVSAVASVAISNGALLTVFERILFVFIGIIVGLIGNKLIFSDYEEKSFT